MMHTFRQKEFGILDQLLMLQLGEPRDLCICLSNYFIGDIQFQELFQHFTIRCEGSLFLYLTQRLCPLRKLWVERGGSLFLHEEVKESHSFFFVDSARVAHQLERYRKLQSKRDRMDRRCWSSSGLRGALPTLRHFRPLGRCTDPKYSPDNISRYAGLLCNDRRIVYGAGDIECWISLVALGKSPFHELIGVRVRVIHARYRMVALGSSLQVRITHLHCWLQLVWLVVSISTAVAASVMAGLVWFTTLVALRSRAFWTCTEPMLFVHGLPLLPRLRQPCWYRLLWTWFRSSRTFDNPRLHPPFLLACSTQSRPWCLHCGASSFQGLRRLCQPRITSLRACLLSLQPRPPDLVYNYVLHGIVRHGTDSTFRVEGCGREEVLSRVVEVFWDSLQRIL